MGRKPVFVESQMLLFDNTLLITPPAPVVKDSPAVDRAHTTKIIALPDTYFGAKGLLRKAFPPMAGIPDDGKIKKVFSLEGNLYAINGSLSLGKKELEYSAYQMVPRDSWNDDVYPVTTVAARIREPRKTHLIHTGCCVTHNGAEYVLYRPTRFVNESVELMKNVKSLEG